MRIEARSLARSPQAVIVLSFAGLIVLGAIALWLPFSRGDRSLGFLDALFTATSAVCVTGLVVVDTGTAFSPLGQGVILFLIQAGGLGVMTFAAVLFRLLGRRLPLASRTVVQESLFQRDAVADMKRLFRQILLTTVAIEAAGALLIWFAGPHGEGILATLGEASFLSISAFCNAGFALRADSLIPVRTNGLILVVLMALIVLGGVGHVVIQEVKEALAARLLRRDRAASRRLSVHTHVVLRMSAILVMLGFFGLLLFGTGSDGAGGRCRDALFQSVTARTAGFNTSPIAVLPSASLFLLVVLMFVGGSPGSCAGGIKTTSLALWLARLRAGIRGEPHVCLVGRRVPDETVDRTSRLIGIAVLWNVLGLLVLLYTETGAEMGEVLFEQISAFGTVGLSTGLTPRLSAAGRIWIVLTMFVGRLGPLTLATWVATRRRANVCPANARVMIG